MRKEEKVFNSEIRYTVNYRDVTYPRLEFRTGKLHLVIPRFSNDEEIISRNISWIKKRQKDISFAMRNSKSKALKSRSVDELKELINNVYFSLPTKSRANRFYFRNMKSKWASISTKHNVTFNTKMRYLPKSLIEYILFHELAHTKRKRHDRNFWRIVEKRFPDYEEKEKDLFEYWFLIEGNI